MPRNRRACGKDRGDGGGGAIGWGVVLKLIVGGRADGAGLRMKEQVEAGADERTGVGNPVGNGYSHGSFVAVGAIEGCINGGGVDAELGVASANRSIFR